MPYVGGGGVMVWRHVEGRTVLILARWRDERMAESERITSDALVAKQTQAAQEKPKLKYVLYRLSLTEQVGAS